MLRFLRILFDWSEVWSLFIPLTILLIKKPAFQWVKPLRAYLIIAVILNTAIDFIWYGNKYKLFDINNNILYNIHAIIRLLLFAWFFNYMDDVFHKLNRVLPLSILIISIAIFYFDGIININSKVLALTSAILLIYCLIFFYQLIKSENNFLLATVPTFWINVGLCLFTAANFFIYLSFNYLIEHNKEFSVDIWDVHNSFYIVMCIFFGIGISKTKAHV